MTDAVSQALAVPNDVLGELGVDVRALQQELGEVAEQALQARSEGLSLAQAVAEPRFPVLQRFHTDLRDALLVEIPREMSGLAQAATDPEPGDTTAATFGKALGDIARTAPPRPEAGDPRLEPAPADRSGALAELLVFEAVRLRLLVYAWQTEDFERLGGTEHDIDRIAAGEVQTLLAEPALADDAVRPLPLMLAAASVSLAADAADRADALRRVGEDTREELAMQARLRRALRQLRLPESVLLSNALSGLLGETRQELVELQQARPLALTGLSRQAMDQRISRGRKALTRSPEQWPRRKRPALFDLLSSADD